MQKMDSARRNFFFSFTRLCLLHSRSHKTGRIIKSYSLSFAGSSSALVRLSRSPLPQQMEPGLQLTAEQLLQLSHDDQLILQPQSDDPSAQRTAYACQGRRLEIG